VINKGKQQEIILRFKRVLGKCMQIPLLNFSKQLEIECDAYSVGIESTILEEKASLTYLVKSSSHINYFPYGKKIYALIRDLQN